MDDFTDFGNYFGIKPSDIKESCIICQTGDISLFSAAATANGFFIKTVNAASATVIALKNNFLAGDAVLCLKNTKCKNIFLFGSCGGCGGAEIGDMMAIDKAYNYESFSKMLSFDANPDFVSSSAEALASFYGEYGHKKLIKTNSACVSSLLLETKYIDLFKQKGIRAVDMESSIVFSAAKKIGAKALCFMYVADLLGIDPFGLKSGEKRISAEKISIARKKLAGMLLDFIDGQ